MTNTEPNRGGRPRRAADPGTLTPAALALLIEHGYDGCTMTDLAQALGVSVRTLHRYFPAKADIVWSPVEQVLCERKALLDASDPDEPPMRVLRRTICTSLQGMAAESEHLRAAVQLISATPELAATSKRVRLGTEATRAFLAERLPEDAWPPLAQVLSEAVSATAMAAMRWWADQPPGAHAPHIVVDEALRQLEAGFTRLDDDRSEQ